MDGNGGIMENIEKERIAELRKLLEYYNYLYYVKNAPRISDMEFDKYMHELEALEDKHPEWYDPNSPTQRVGNDSTNEFVQVSHRYGMMSLANTYSEQEIRDFDERVRKGLGNEEVEYVCELKYDGTSISLRYEDGNLKVAVTRGDGEKGDDVRRMCVRFVRFRYVCREMITRKSLRYGGRY